MALYNSNADEIFTLQSLHNQGIGSGGGGGGDIGNFISIGRDESSFPGFYSIAMGDNSVASGEGSIAFGNNCKTFANMGGLTSGKGNISISNFNYYTSPWVIGLNNYAITNNTALILGNENYLNKFNAIKTDTLYKIKNGTMGLFYGYFDYNSKLLYSDKEMTQIIEYTVPADGAYIVDYNPQTNYTTQREESQIQIYYTADGTTFVKYNVSGVQEAALIVGYNNGIKSRNQYNFGTVIVGSSNEYDSGLSRSTSSTLYGSTGPSFSILGRGNKILNAAVGSDPLHVSIEGVDNEVNRFCYERPVFVRGRLNKVYNSNSVQIYGNSNTYYGQDSWEVQNAILGSGNNFYPEVANSYGSFNGLYGYNCIVGCNNNILKGSNGAKTIFGYSNAIRGGVSGSYNEVIELVKNDGQYYQVTYTNNSTTGLRERTIGTTPITPSSYSYYLYNNGIYKGTGSDLSSTNLLTTQRAAPLTGYSGEISIIGHENRIFDGSYIGILGCQNKYSSGYGGHIVGRGNTFYYGNSSVVEGINNFAKGHCLQINGYKNIVSGYNQTLIGNYNLTGNYNPINSGDYPDYISVDDTGTYDRRNKIFYHNNGQLVDDGETLKAPFRDGDAFIGEYSSPITPVDGNVYRDSDSGIYYQYSEELNDFIPIDSRSDEPSCFNDIVGHYNNILAAKHSVVVGHANRIDNPNADHIFMSGFYNNVVGTSNASYLTIEGVGNTGSGSYGHVEGYRNEVHGEAAHAEGYRTIASGDYQHVSGKYNIEDTDDDYALIVGGGTDDTHRANILTLDWNGNLSIAGNFSFNVPTPVNPGDIMTKGVTDGYITDAYDDTATYDVGDYCIYNNTLYKCASAIAVAEPWTAAHWTATDIATELTAIKALAQQLPWTDIDQTLTAGQTTLTISNAAITSTSAIQIFTNAFGVEPTNMVLATGSVTLTFIAQQNDINVKVRVS